MSSERKIEVTSRGTTTIGVKITGLDTTYSASTRQCDWAVSTDERTWIIKKHDDSIAAKASEHESTIPGLTPGTTYYLKAFITNIQGYDDVEVVYNGTVTTRSDTRWTIVNLGSYNVSNNEVQTASSINFPSYTIYRFSAVFSQSGQVTCYSTGRNDTRVWVSDSSSTALSSDGIPVNYFTDDDDSGSDSNFSCTFAATAGTTYYFWVRTPGRSVVFYSDVFLTPQAEPETEEGIYIYNGSRWVKATAYIYTSSSGWVKATPYIYNGNTWKKA